MFPPSYKVLVTGNAGFIGHHLAKRLTLEGYRVYGLDSVNDYYDTNLKCDRLRDQGFVFDELTLNHEISSTNSSVFIRMHLEDKDSLFTFFERNQFDIVIHLAAQAGVRYSLTDPQAYVHSNMEGFLNLLEACRHYPVRHVIYASSSSVYGLNRDRPFSVEHNTDHPVSLYAASKKSNELMAHVYSHLFDIPTTGLRFFTVYGPWGRPDMALFLFTKAILEGKPIRVFNNGEMERDFTYIDDITEGILRLLHLPPKAEPENYELVKSPSSSTAPYRLFNIGSHAPVKLLDFISLIEQYADRPAIKDFQPMQPGDISSTYADVQSLFDFTGFRPATSLSQGVKEFVQWYKNYYHLPVRSEPV